jgi:hypothetical protein
MVKEVNEVSVIESQMLPVFNAPIELEMIGNEYHLKNYDSLVESLKQFNKQVNNYTYNDNDRQPIKKIKSAANKTIKAFKQEVKKQQEALFSPVTSEAKEIETLMTKLSKGLAKGLDEDDKRVKAEKKAELTELFEDAKETIPSLADLDFDFDDIYDVAWLNRTASRNKTIASLDSRMETISMLVANPVLANNDIQEIIEYLEDADWDGLKAQNNLTTLNVNRQEEELNRQLIEEARRRKELEEKEKDILSKDESVSSAELVTLNDDEAKSMTEAKKLIKVNVSDWARVRDLLLAAQIEFEEVL